MSDSGESGTMSDTGDSRATSDTGDSSVLSDWSLVDKHGELRDEDTTSTTSSVEVVDDDDDEDDTNIGPVTPVAGSPLGISPRFILRLPSHKQDASDTDEETAEGVTSPGVSQELNTVSPAGVKAGQTYRQSTSEARVSQEQLEELRQTLDSLKRNLQPTLAEDSSLSSIELFGDGKPDRDIFKTDSGLLPQRQVESIGIHGNTLEDGNLSMQSSVSSSYSFLSRDAGTMCSLLRDKSGSTERLNSLGDQSDQEVVVTPKPVNSNPVDEQENSHEKLTEQGPISPDCETEQGTIRTECQTEHGTVSPDCQTGTESNVAGIMSQFVQFPMKYIFLAILAVYIGGITVTLFYIGQQGQDSSEWGDASNQCKIESQSLQHNLDRCEESHLERNRLVEAKADQIKLLLGEKEEIYVKMKDKEREMIKIQEELNTFLEENKSIKKTNQGLQGKQAEMLAENERLQNIVDQSRTQCADWKRYLDKCHADSDGVKQKSNLDVENVRRETEKELYEVQRKCQSDLDNLKSQYQFEIDSVRNQYQSDLDQVRKQYQSDLDQVRKNYQSNLDSVRMHTEAHEKYTKSHCTADRKQGHGHCDAETRNENRKEGTQSENNEEADGTQSVHNKKIEKSQKEKQRKQMKDGKEAQSTKATRKQRRDWDDDNTHSTMGESKQEKQSDTRSDKSSRQTKHSDKQSNNEHNKKDNSEKYSGEEDNSGNYWADTVLDIMNKTREQIQDTWAKVKNMSESFWQEHQPTLSRLQDSFTRKFQHLSKKFKNKLARKINKWFRKGKRHSQKENNGPQTNTKRRQYSSDDAESTNSCYHKIAVSAQTTKFHADKINEFIVLPCDVSSSNRTVEERLVKLSYQVEALNAKKFRKWRESAKVWDIHREFEQVHIVVNTDDQQQMEKNKLTDRYLEWLRCQFRWWKDLDVVTVTDDCYLSLCCWQVKVTGWDVKQCKRVKRKKGIVEDTCSLEAVHQTYKSHGNHQNRKTGSGKNKFQKNDHIHQEHSDTPYNKKGTVNQKAASNDQTEENWFLEMGEEREYHRGEPDDWFFRRKNKPVSQNGKKDKDKDLYEDYFDDDGFVDDYDEACDYNLHTGHCIYP